jgi:hypothetical protein
MTTFMKNFIKTIVTLCAVAAVFALASCKPKTAAPQFATIEKAETLRAGQGSMELDYRFEYLSGYSGEAVASKIRTAMTADFFGNDYAGTDPAESAKAFEQAVSKQYTDSVSGGRGWNGYVKIRSHRDVIRDCILAYTVERAEYTGGAHGLETTMYYNYDLRTGARLTLDDVFTPHGKDALAGTIRARILKEYGKTSWNELAAEYCYMDAAKVLPTENFLLSADQITFMYNPYDIACYAQGSTKVRLPLAGLDGFRKELLVK